jgi:hypothetical protein
VLNAHRTEKTSRANTAAIIVEKLAAETQPVPDSPTTDSSAPVWPPHRVETDAAIYDNAKVYLKGNPLVTTSEIRCHKCGLSKLLYPSDGVGAREPAPGVEYCKSRPYILKDGHDIFGLPFPREKAAGAKKEKNLNKPSSQSFADSGSFDSPAPSTPPPGQDQKIPTFPDVKCPNCSRKLDVRRFRGHLKTCMGISSRTGRTAQLKTNGNGFGQTSSQNGSTPPKSRNSTPLPPGIKKSPIKRARDDFDDDDEPTSDSESEEETAKKKKRKVLAKGKPNGTPSLAASVVVGVASMKGKMGVKKKWKSGKVTVDGKAVIPPLAPPAPIKNDRLDKDKLPKKFKKDRASTPSSATLSTP